MTKREMKLVQVALEACTERFLVLADADEATRKDKAALALAIAALHVVRG